MLLAHRVGELTGQVDGCNVGGQQPSKLGWHRRVPQGGHGPPTFQGRTKNIFVINYTYKGNELVAPPTLKHLLMPMTWKELFAIVMAVHT